VVFILNLESENTKKHIQLRQIRYLVICVANETCVLPCSYQSSSDPLVHWFHMTPQYVHVHAYYRNKDQLSFQESRYRGRTSLFKDQVSRGNWVEVQDQGRYNHSYSTFHFHPTLQKELYVKQIRFVCFAAPVRKVDLQQVGDRITCSSEGIYPEPELTWSTSPPSNVTFKNQPEVQKTEQLLYNISSYLIPSDTDTDVGYSCTVSTHFWFCVIVLSLMMSPKSVDQSEFSNIHI
uniref:Ig-like domain-containing protein n=1 Tax=Seriola dumerili TaxID=41447 RepID=A0A3B4U0A5_SERDU